MKSPKYLKHIRSLDCIVTQTPAFGFSQIVAHHLNKGSGRGISQKASDYRTVPLRADIHQLLHSQPEQDFWDEVGIDPFMYALDILIDYVES